MESTPGQGSTFHVILDLEKVHMQELPLKLPERSILVIDDDKRVLQTATEMLRSIGLNPEPVFDEEQGLQLACQRQKAGEGYHMILLDWSLKEPGCIYMIEQLRLQLGNETPVIILFDGDWGEVETDYEDGRMIYEGKFFHGTMEYEFEIDAATGQVRKWEMESMYD